MKEVPIVAVKERKNIKCGYEIYPVFFSYAYNMLSKKYYAPAEPRENAGMSGVFK